AVKHSRNAFDDREAESDTTSHSCSLIEPMKLLEHSALLGLRNSDAGVVDLDAQLFAAAAAADQDAPGGRVFDRVGNEILQEAPYQAAIGSHRQRTRHDDELQALLAGERRELDLKAVQQFVNAKLNKLRLHHSGVEPRDIEKCRENFLHCFQRSVDVSDERAILA